MTVEAIDTPGGGCRPSAINKIDRTPVGRSPRSRSGRQVSRSEEASRAGVSALGGSISNPRCPPGVVLGREKIVVTTVRSRTVAAIVAGASAR